MLPPVEPAQGLGQVMVWAESPQQPWLALPREAWSVAALTLALMPEAWFQLGSFLPVSELAQAQAWAVGPVSPQALWLTRGQALPAQALVESLSCQNDWAEAAERLSRQKP